MTYFTGLPVELQIEHKGERKQTVSGVVIWQHPKRRFVLIQYTVKTLFGTRVMRECAKIVRNRLDGARIIHEGRRRHGR